MLKKNTDFKTALHKSEAVVRELGLVIHFTHNLDPFFKGDLDGKRIFIGSHLDAEDKLFNLLHLAGHCIQWNVDPLLREMGSELYLNPDDELLRKLQAYEWQANCYGLAILHKAGVFNLNKWLTKEYIRDMIYLTHFYKTGKKLKRMSKEARDFPFTRALQEMPLPSFTPKAAPRTRNGIVISID
jgi:hypothetical protein